MSKETGGPAYPSGNEVVLGDWRSSGHAGMTLRDYFAAKAMQGQVASEGEATAEDMASWAYLMADAMLAERAK